MGIKIDLGSILSKVAIVQALVSAVQDRFKGSKTSAEKKQAVIESLRDVIPAVEGVAEKDLFDDVEFEKALSALIDAEKAVYTARKNVEAFIVAAKHIKK